MRHCTPYLIHNRLRAKDIEQSQDYAVQRFAAAPTIKQDRAHRSRIDKRGRGRQRSVQHLNSGVDRGGVAGARALGDYEPEFGGRKVGGLRSSTLVSISRNTLALHVSICRNTIRQILIICIRLARPCAWIIHEHGRAPRCYVHGAPAKPRHTLFDAWLCQQRNGSVCRGRGAGIRESGKNRAPTAGIARHEDGELFEAFVWQGFAWQIVWAGIYDPLAPRFELSSFCYVCHIEEHSIAGKVRKDIVRRGPEYVKRRTIKKIKK
jgi:hypothetical protein